MMKMMKMMMMLLLLMMMMMMTLYPSSTPYSPIPYIHSILYPIPYFV